MVFEYEAPVLFGPSLEELYESVLALRRLLEAIEAKAPLKDIESVMQKYGITEQMLEEGLGDVED